jgi:hypothetical protein
LVHLYPVAILVQGWRVQMRPRQGPKVGRLGHRVAGRKGLLLHLGGPQGGGGGGRCQLQVAAKGRTGREVSAAVVWRPTT